MRPIHILIADDSKLIHDRLKKILSSIDGIKTIDQAYTTDETLEKVITQQPDWIVLDISMPTTSGLEVLKEVKQKFPEIKIIIFTNYPSDQFKEKAQRYKADYFFNKEDGFVQIPKILKRLSMDDNYINQLIEHVAESIVITNPSDLQAMGVILDKFEEITNWVKEAGEPVLVEAATKMIQLVKDIILEDVEDINVTMEIIGNTLTAFQAVVRDNKNVDEVEFPEALGLSNPDQGRSEESDPTETKGLYHPHGLPGHVDMEVFADFLSNQEQVLEDIEGCVLEIEQTGSEGKVSELKRILHTLKGESGLIGLKDVENLCHRTEDFMTANETGSIVDQLLAVKDWLRNAFDRYLCKTDNLESVETVLELLSGDVSAKVVAENAENKEGDPQAKEAMKTEMEKQDSVQEEPTPVDETPQAPPTSSENEPFTGDVDLVTDFISEANEHLDEADNLLLNLENDPDDSTALDGIFRAFHTLKGVAGFLDLKEIGKLAHEAENLLDKARKGTLQLSGPSMDITFESVDSLKRMIEALGTAVSNGIMPPAEPGLQNLIDRIEAVRSGENPPEKIKIEQEEESGPEEKADVPNETAPAVVPTPAKTTSTKKPSAPVKKVHLKETLKVDAQRLDLLIDTIGELVIAESMINQSREIQTMASQELTKHISQMDKITRELQNMGTALRMVTVRQTFQKMARLVRDLSKKSGKKVDFVMDGEDTEIDKTVVDKIGDPLVHMIRNAVDHGIEDSKEDRVKAGKPAHGQIELRAFHKGGNISIEVEDDGRGLNSDVILAKAKERGLVKEGESLSEREIWNLVLEPGFSTAKKVTEISGRGVGMDVVKRNIEALRGRVEITSKPGKGSIFSIRLPLTLAIIEGMVVRVGTEKYIIPTLSVNESLRPDPDSVNTVFDKGEVLTFHEELVPIIRLDQVFDIEGAEQDPTKAILVVFDAESHRAAVLVDELLGQQQVVIKSLGETMQNIMGLSGCTIMGDGHVGLILDMAGLIKVSQGNDNQTVYSQAV